MTKESKNSKQLPQIRVFIGRCWARKYNNTCKAVERRIHDKYTSKVVVSGGFKKCAKWRTTLNYVALFSSAFLFLILMFANAIIDMVGCVQCSPFKDFIENYRMTIYFIAIALYTISYFSTMTRCFYLYVDNSIVYARTFKQRLDSVDEIMAVFDYYIKAHYPNYDSYLKQA